MSTKPHWIKLAEVIELARDKAGVGEGKIKEMLRTDAALPEDQRTVLVNVFPNCTRRRYGRASICKLLQISEG